MVYVAFVLLVVVIFIWLVDRNRLFVYYPTYLFAVAIGHLGDRLFVYVFRLYDYTDPQLPSHIVSILAHYGFYPLVGLLFVQYVERKGSFLIPALTWTAGFTLLEGAFVLGGLFTYYRWNLGISAVGWFLTWALLFSHHRWWRRHIVPTR